MPKTDPREKRLANVERRSSYIRTVIRTWREQEDEGQDQVFYELLLGHLNKCADEAREVVRGAKKS